MQQEIIATYLDLMDKLAELPDAIAQQQAALTEVKQAQSDIQRHLDEIEMQLTPLANGESNAEKRKAKLAELCNQEPTYRQKAQELTKAKFDLMQLNDAVANLERQYEAVCYQSRLHSGLMNYLGSAGAPVQFTFKANGHISAADAAAIGL